MSSVGMTIEIKGKLFDIGADKRLRDAMNQGILRMAFVTEGRVKGQLYKPGNFPQSRHGMDQGHLRRSVEGELVKDLKAQVDAGSLRQGANVVYASWIEGTSARNKTTSFEGYHMFRNAFKKMEAEEKDKYFAKPIRKALV